MESYNVTFCVWLLLLSTSFWDSSSKHCSTISTSSPFMAEYIPLYGYATICLSIHLLMNICGVFIFRLLWKCWYEHLYTSICLNICFNSFGYIPMSRSAGSYGNSIINFLRNCQTAYHSGWIILHSHEQCRWVPISLHPCNQPTSKIYKIKLYYTIRHIVNIYLSQRLSLS